MPETSSADSPAPAGARDRGTPLDFDGTASHPSNTRPNGVPETESTIRPVRGPAVLQASAKCEVETRTAPGLDENGAPTLDA